MSRSDYYNFIEEKLSLLSVRIENRGKLNILDLHLQAESFYLHFMNLIFGWHLESMNAVQHNAEAFDLIDKINKIIIQVSATATKQKIESTLKKELSDKKGYTFKFISISKNADKLRTISYNNPSNLSFDPQSDIYDTGKFLEIVLYDGIEKQKIIYNFIKKELGEEPDLAKIDSNLTRIINILAHENWDSVTGDYEINEFEIDRKIEYNSLSSAKIPIEDYALHFIRVDKIYKEFNKSGVNKSSSVLASIRNIYISNKDSINNDDLFFKVIEQVTGRIQNSANYTEIPFEELEMCVNILVVDTFIRCKIFKNPKGYIYAPSR
jgi:SMEK domain/C-terminal domain 10 of the ABC-three component (ABC-3C) systems